MIMICRPEAGLGSGLPHFGVTMLTASLNGLMPPNKEGNLGREKVVCPSEFKLGLYLAHHVACVKGDRDEFKVLIRNA